MRSVANRTCLVAILAACVPVWAQAQTDPPVEAPLPVRPPDGVALFGELVSIGPKALVLREMTFLYAPDAQTGEAPAPATTERAVQIPEGTPITSSSPGGLQPGARLFVGAREVEGALIALMISEVAALPAGQATDPESVRAALSGPLEEALATGTLHEPTAAPPHGLSCLAANGFAPDAATLDFRGCYGGPTLNASASFAPVKIYGNGPPETFTISVSRFDVNLGLAGYNYQFPFRFSVVDPDQVALEAWARQCLAQYGSVEAGVCPLPRPWVPGPTQPRNIRVNATPVDPSPAPTMNGAFGVTLGLEFRFWFSAGCGPVRLDPCTFTVMIDLGNPGAQVQRAHGAAPLRQSEILNPPPFFIGGATPPASSAGVLRAEAQACAAYGTGIILGLLGIPFVISTLISPFDLLVCQPFELYNNTQPGFSARVSEGRYQQGTLMDLEGNIDPRVTFRGVPRTLRLYPRGPGAAKIRFQQFDYRLDWLFKVRLDLSSSLVTWFRGPEWISQYITGMPFVYSGNYEFTDGGPCNGSFASHSADATGFSRYTPLCIELDVPLAQFGNASVSSLMPVVVSAEGGTTVRVTGTGFKPTKRADGSPYPGTGVTRVVLHATAGDMEVPFVIRSDSDIDLVMPAHPPTLEVDENGDIQSFRGLGLTFYAWGTTLDEGIYYGARPIVGHVSSAGGIGVPTALPTGSVMGGERVVISGNKTGWVTDVFFGDARAVFAECFTGQTNPLCAGVSGSQPYNPIVAVVPTGAGQVEDCPTGAGTRCDHITIRSLCFGDDLGQGRPAPGVYCGQSLPDEDAIYVRKTLPQINSLTPAGGPPGTNVQVTLSGVGFGGFPTVRIGDTIISGICNGPGCPGGGSDTQLVVTVPAAAVGTSQITVTNPCPAAFGSRCGTSFPRSFRHLDTPQVTSVSPAQGTWEGGTVVTVQGTGLATATSLTLGGVSVPFTPDGTPDTRLTFTTPLGYPDLVDGLPESVNVVVTVACGTAATTNANACGSSAPLPFTYLPPEIRYRPIFTFHQGVTGEPGRATPVNVTMRNIEGDPIPGRTVSFSLHGINVGTAVTNASGVATLIAIMPSIPTGVYEEEAVVTFAGDAVYSGTTWVTGLVVTHPEVVAWGQPARPSSIDVPALLQGVSAVSAGGAHVLALKFDGTVVGWGDAAFGGAPPAGLSGVTAISAGLAHSLALKFDGTVVKWGAGGGSLPALPPIKAISAGLNLSVAITTAGDLVAWSWEFNPNNPALSNIPTAGGDPFVAVAAGSTHALALRQSGTVVAWGNPGDWSTEVPAGLTNVVAIAANWLGNLALRSDGTVVGWGYSCVPSCSPDIGAYLKAPAGLTGVQAVGVNQSFDGRAGYAKRADGTLVAWSRGAYVPLNAPAGYDVNVESFSLGGENGSPFTVVRRRPRVDTSLSADPVTGFAGDPVTLRAVLKTGTAGVELREVTFTLGGVSQGTATTSANTVNLPGGIATKAATIPALAPGVYPTGVSVVFPTPPLGFVGSSASAPLVVRSNQTISFDPLGDRTFDQSPFTVSASATSMLPVTFAASGACSVAGNLVTLTGIGACTITASQAGTVVFTPAGDVGRSFGVARASQAISFAPLADVPFGRAPVGVEATATSRLPVTLTSLTPTVCSAIGGRVHSLTVGVCAVAADQPGNVNVFPAPRVTRSFAITLDAFDLSRQPSQLDPPSGQVAAGFFHTCALTAAGGVKCWGHNGSGQLGDGTTTERLMAVDVTGLGGAVTLIAAGGYHTCAVMDGGSVKCWGSNANGELGNGSTNPASAPVVVTGLSGVVGIAAGASHTCALTAAGRVRCWGSNGSGQLGNNSSAQSLVPVDVSGPGGSGLLSNRVAIAAGAYSTCASGFAGGVLCWGAGDEGQLGSGSTSASSTPVAVVGPDGTGRLKGVAGIAAGEYHACVVTDGGVPYCWGRNFLGQLGDGTGAQSLVPVAVSNLPGSVTGVVTGGNHTCAVTATNGVKCWGWNTSGQLGDGTTVTRLAPAEAPGMSFGMARLVGGGNHTCALTITGGVRCWGSNSNGQLGNNSTADRSTFVDVAGLSAGVAQASLGVSHACALTPAGGVQCWGYNDQGQLGDGTTNQRSTPADVTGLKGGVSALAVGGYHACALTQAGGVKCWGWNPFGAIGDGTNGRKLVPTDVAGLGSGVSRIAAGEYHTCALLASGGVKCWGSNEWGQLGDGTSTDRWAPVDWATPVSAIVSMVAGNSHNCVVTAGGAAKCWGRNTNGQLGEGSTTGRSTPPADVTGLGTGVLGIAAGGDHTCAFLADDVTKCWGNNAGGQLGDGSQTEQSTPVALNPALSGVSSLALGGNNSCAMAADGAVICWGSNATGQLGDGTTVGRSEATLEVEGLGYGAAAMGGADGHNCAITGAGGLRCWGNNVVGQIGDGTTTHRLAPVEIRGGQTIRWSSPAAIGLLQPGRLSASATSGLPVTLESLTPSFCTIREGRLMGAATGLCLVRARQAGDNNHAAAPPQLRLIPVTGGEEPPRRAARQSP